MTDESDLEYRKRAHTAQVRYKLPRGARQILLIRHGASVGPTLNTLQLGEITITNPELAPDGETQAEALASWLKDEPIAAIFVTPLRRTHQTAAPLAAAKGLTPVSIPDLREIYLGDWEHNFYEYAEAGHPLVAEMFVRETWEVIPNAETREQFAGRVRRGIETVAASIPEGATAISFSHAATIAEICCQATSSRPFAFMAPENTSVSRLVVGADGTWKLRSYNDVSHLGYA